MSPVLSIGVVGCGRIVQRVHLPALATLPEIRVAAIAEPDADRRAAASALAPGARAHTDLDALLDDDGVEAVLVCTPSHLHVDAALAVLAAGRHLYLEKPLAHRVEDGRRIVRAWHAAGVVGMAGFNYRFDPLYGELRRRIAEGAVALQSAFTTPPHELPGWKRARDTGGGALLDLGSHHLDLVRFLLDAEIETVSAFFASRRSEDDTVTLSLTTSAGVPVQIVAAIGSADHDGFIAYTGDARILVDRHARTLHVETPPSGWGLGARVGRAANRAVRSAGDTVRMLRPPVQPSYRAALHVFARAIRHEAPCPVDLADGLANLLAIDAAERSRTSGRPEPVELMRRIGHADADGRASP